MKQTELDHPDPDDMFADTRMSFGEHIEDLRTHLLRAIYGFIIGFVIAVPLGAPVLRFISAPVEQQLQDFNRRYNDTRITEVRRRSPQGDHGCPASDSGHRGHKDRHLGGKAWPAATRRSAGGVLNHLLPASKSVLSSLKVHRLVDWQKMEEGEYVEFPAMISNPLDVMSEMLKYNSVLMPKHLKTLSLQEPIMVLFKVIIMLGLIIASPWVFYQLWSFVAAGLYPSEKRLVNVYLPFSVALFLIGILICQFFVLPKAIEAMLWFNEYLGFEPDLRLSEWLGFAIFMPAVFGVSFQTPLAMYFLEMIGIFTVDGYRSMRRIAWFVLAIFAAVITPTVDALSMMFLWVPMCILYELGIWMCQFSGRSRKPEWDTSPDDDNVEV